VDWKVEKRLKERQPDERRGMESGARWSPGSGQGLDCAHNRPMGSHLRRGGQTINLAKSGQVGS